MSEYGCVMTFPETVEEFMEDFKIVDTEQVYTNGTELVPIFRMEQWFDAHPQRKRGKWRVVSRQADFFTAYRCSECNELVYARTNFCSNCGAEMRGEANDNTR